MTCNVTVTCNFIGGGEVYGYFIYQLLMSMQQALWKIIWFAKCINFIPLHILLSLCISANRVHSSLLLLFHETVFLLFRQTALQGPPIYCPKIKKRIRNSVKAALLLWPVLISKILCICNYSSIHWFILDIIILFVKATHGVTTGKRCYSIFYAAPANSVLWNWHNWVRRINWISDVESTLLLRYSYFSSLAHITHVSWRWKRWLHCDLSQ